jgi:hypothetical protein
LKKHSSSMSPCAFLTTIHPRSSMETTIFIAYRLLQASIPVLGSPPAS